MLDNFGCVIFLIFFIVFILEFGIIGFCCKVVIDSFFIFCFFKEFVLLEGVVVCLFFDEFGSEFEEFLVVVVDVWFELVKVFFKCFLYVIGDLLWFVFCG